jgi:hypothetical protein
MDIIPVSRGMPRTYGCTGVHVNTRTPSVGAASTGLTRVEGGHQGACLWFGARLSRDFVVQQAPTREPAVRRQAGGHIVTHNGAELLARMAFSSMSMRGSCCSLEESCPSGL